ncbi:serine/arginine-rich splicing factor 4 isoform X2 [Daktulosphaira vitifoliae]|uniref:serine/arginine-rich splicing factor 4 isoform X2 n=1 Tax=Daktulosphaira vitifoliae TaxID=58002 RepID=UPI0021AAAD09|nr:serine/arginine-rich splicing factor 4 isoform X2 [Daktulosphaira vitifoliae]
MSRNERLKVDKRASTSRARSKDSPRRELENVVKRARRDRDQSQYWINKVLEAEEKDPNRWKHSGFKELYTERRSRSISKRSSSSFSSSCTRSSMHRSLSRRRRRLLSPDIRRSQRSLSVRRASPLSRRRSPFRSKKSPLSLRSRRRRKSSSESPITNSSRLRRSRSLSRKKRSPLFSRNHRIISPSHKKRGNKKHGRKHIRHSSEDVRSSSVSTCSDSHCSVCEARIPMNRREPPPEPLARPKSPKIARAIIPIHERSRSRSFSVPRYTPVVEVSSTTGLPKSSGPPEPAPTKTKRTKKIKSHKKKKSHKVKSSHIETAILHQPTIKVESMSDEDSSVGGSDMPMSSSSGGHLTLSERFSKMAQMGRAHELPQRSLRVTAGDDYRVEIGSPPHPFPTPAIGSLPEGTSIEDVKGRYAYYKEQGYLGDLSLTDYVKWEEWWYKYQDWLEAERAYDAHLDRYTRDRRYRDEPPIF